MKNTIANVILFAAILFAAATYAPAQDKKDDTATSATTNAAHQATTIPADAVLNPDGRTYSYTDKEGKKWTYLRTPFGITRVAATDKPAAATPFGIKSVAATDKPAAPPRDTSRIKVIDKGDTVRFERPSPFGPMGYEKTKSELTEEERRIVDSYKADSYKADSYKSDSNKTDTSKAKTQQNEKNQ